jgi:hypothetical protein
MPDTIPRAPATADMTREEPEAAFPGLRNRERVMTAADRRVTAAREFLRHVRTGPKPAAMPRSALDRQAAELRKLLGQVLDWAGTRPATTSDAQREVLAQALADAITYRDPAGFCPGCEQDPYGLCDDHAGDLDLTDSYLQLAAELGIEVEL